MQKLGSFAKGFRWKKDNESRTVAFNLVVPIVGNNIDLYLFNHEPTDFSNKKIAWDIPISLTSYIAPGELKGGIDPQLLMNTGKQPEHILIIFQTHLRIGCKANFFEMAIEAKWELKYGVCSKRVYFQMLQI